MNAWHELLFKTQLQQLITEREGMLAENQYRLACGHQVAYSEDAFFILQNKFVQLEESIRANG